MYRSQNYGRNAAERQRRYRFRKRELSSRVCLLCERGNMWEHRYGCNISGNTRSRSSPPTQYDVTALSTAMEPTLSAADLASENPNPTPRAVVSFWEQHYQTPRTLSIVEDMRYALAHLPRILPSPVDSTYGHRSSAISPPPLRTIEHTNDSDEETSDSDRSPVPNYPKKNRTHMLAVFRDEMLDECVKAEAFRRETSDRLEKLDARLRYLEQHLSSGASTPQIRKGNLEEIKRMTKMEDLDAFLVRLLDAEFREQSILLLSRLVCSDPRLSVSNMLRALFAPEFAEQLTWLKGEDKRPISGTQLPRLIKDAIYSVATHSRVAVDFIEKSIQAWFKGAFDRIPGNRRLRRERAALRPIKDNQ